MTETELKKVLEQHKIFLKSEGKAGKCANLSGADLSGADLSFADLSCANLTDADLRGANLYFTNLTEANLINAKLYNTEESKLNAKISALENALETAQGQFNVNIKKIKAENAELKRARTEDFCLIQTLKQENAHAIDNIVTLVEENQKLRQQLFSCAPAKINMADLVGFDLDYVEEEVTAEDWEDYEPEEEPEPDGTYAVYY